MAIIQVCAGSMLLSAPSTCSVIETLSTQFNHFWENKNSMPHGSLPMPFLGCRNGLLTGFTLKKKLLCLQYFSAMKMISQVDICIELNLENENVTCSTLLWFGYFHCVSQVHSRAQLGVCGHLSLLWRWSCLHWTWFFFSSSGRFEAVRFKYTYI